MALDISSACVSFENAIGIKEKSQKSMICDDRSHTYFLILPEACETSQFFDMPYLMAKPFPASTEGYFVQLQLNFHNISISF